MENKTAMTNEDIIKQFEPNREYPSYYHESNVLEAMDAARKDEAIRFAEWQFNKIVRQDEDGFYFDYSGGTAFTMEQLYSLFKQKDNGKGS